jgi:predicted DNA-binding transcriptional regulator YafY
LQGAVARRRVVRMEYRGRERAEATRREVEPLGLVFYGGRWYLVAWCRLRGDLRHFRLDRIQSLETTASACEARPGFDLAAHMAECAASDQAYPARVWVADEHRARAKAESYATLVEVEGSRREGGAEFTLLTWSYEWLAGWLFSFGGGAEAVSPPELRERVTRLAGEVLARHGARAGGGGEGEKSRREKPS